MQKNIVLIFFTIIVGVYYVILHFRPCQLFSQCQTESLPFLHELILLLEKLGHVGVLVEGSLYCHETLYIISLGCSSRTYFLVSTWDQQSS